MNIFENYRLNKNKIPHSWFNWATTTTHKKCFSLGIHIDFKKKYIDFHLGWWFFHIGGIKNGVIL